MVLREVVAPPQLAYLSDELQDLVLGVRGREDPKGLQPTQAPLDLPLLLLQGQVAVGDEGLVALHLLGGAGVPLSPPVHHPAVLSFLRERGDTVACSAKPSLKHQQSCTHTYHSHTLTYTLAKLSAQCKAGLSSSFPSLLSLSTLNPFASFQFIT